jgi:hypothetical protein
VRIVRPKPLSAVRVFKAAPVAAFGLRTRIGTGDRTLLIPHVERAGTVEFGPAPSSLMKVVGTLSVISTRMYGVETTLSAAQAVGNGPVFGHPVATETGGKLTWTSCDPDPE